MQAYLISYDNGEPYEDHYISPILIVTTEARAKEVIAEMEAWVAEAKTRMPKYPEGEVSDEAYERWLDFDSVFRASLKPPYGVDDLLSMVYSEGAYARPHLRLKPVPYIT